MNVQRAAAPLVLGYDHFAAVPRQHTYCRIVEPSEGQVGDAAGEERNAILLFILGGNHATQAFREEGCLHAWREARQVGEVPRKDLQHAGTQYCLFKP